MAGLGSEPLFIAVESNAATRQSKEYSGTRLIVSVLTGVRISGLARKNVTEASFINVKTKSDIFTTKILFNFSAVAVTREK